jgi:hypothetical protein
MATRAIFLGNDFTATYNVRRFTPTPAPAGYKAASGLTTLKAKLCVLPDLGAAPIHGLLDLFMVEDSGTPGFYFATFDGGDLTDYLTPYVGQVVYLVLYLDEDLYVVEPLKVFDKRRASATVEA